MEQNRNGKEKQGSEYNYQNDNDYSYTSAPKVSELITRYRNSRNNLLLTDLKNQWKNLLNR